MKNLTPLWLILSVIIQLNLTTFCRAQAILNENFDYDLGKLTDLSTGWSESPTGSVDVEVVNGSLTYTDYPSSGSGRMIELNGGATGRSGIATSFSAVSGNGNKIYASFLLNVTSDVDLDAVTSDGDYYGNFHTGTALRNYLYIKKGSGEGKIKLGIAKSSSTSLQYISGEYDLNTTYLIVIAYIFQSGDDLCRLWINPSLSGLEPAADLEISSGADASSIESLQFRQSEISGDMQIDGVRIATSWDDAPLPVELSSFTASCEKGKIILRWRTETEICNFGFDVERTVTECKFVHWEKIGFVAGNGNCNSPREYCFTDNEISSASTCCYRLKQIDFNGTSEYSDQVCVEINASQNFVLHQNYPNPFNPTTRISFEIPVESKVILVVYNVLGEVVEILAENYFQAGMHDLVFDGNRFSSGIYFYSLQAGNQKIIKKMLLIK